MWLGLLNQQGAENNSALYYNPNWELRGVVGPWFTKQNFGWEAHECHFSFQKIESSISWNNFFEKSQAMAIHAFGITDKLGSFMKKMKVMQSKTH